MQGIARTARHCRPFATRAQSYLKAAMEEADDIMVSIGAIFELVQEKFAEAAEGMHKGLPPGAPVRWTGLEGDVRADTSRRLREEVNQLKAVFDRIQGSIDASPAASLRPEEIEAETARLKAVVAGLHEAKTWLVKAKDIASADVTVEQQPAGVAAAPSSAMED